jgi:hypothetical protein
MNEYCLCRIMAVRLQLFKSESLCFSLREIEVGSVGLLVALKPFKHAPASPTPLAQ